MKKEEQKQHLIDMMKGDEELGMYDESREIKIEDIFNDEKRENIKKFIDEIKNPSEPNQALKEAAHEYFKRGQLGFEKASDTERAFLNGAKWQQERSYSEEDMREAYKYGKIYDMTSFEEWIEEFKNK